MSTYFLLGNLPNIQSPNDVRQMLCDHLLKFKEHYMAFVPGNNIEEQSSTFLRAVWYLKNPGHWDGTAGEIMPLAASNVFKKNIAIFDSGICQYVNITPTQCQPCGDWYYGYISM